MGIAKTWLSTEITQGHNIDFTVVPGLDCSGAVPGKGVHQFVHTRVHQYAPVCVCACDQCEESSRFSQTGH